MANLQRRLFPRQTISSLPPPSSCVPFQNTIGGALLWPHCRHTSHRVQIFAPILWLFCISFVKTVGKGILREFPAQACKVPLSSVREMHAAEYLSSQGGWERSRLVSLTNYSSTCGLVNMCLWCIHGLHTGTVDTKSLVAGKGR